MKKTLIFLIVILCVAGYSQHNKFNTDSIYKLIPGAPDTTKCKKLNFISRQLCQNYPDSAFFLADSAKRLGIRIGFKKGVAYSYFLLGLIVQNNGKFYEAINYYDKALTLYQNLNSKNDLSNVYNCIANVYSQMGNDREAGKNYQIAFDLANKEPKSKYYLAITSFGLALIKSNEKLYEEAIKLNLIALSYFKELGMEEYIPMVMQNTAENYIDLKQYNNAKSYNAQTISSFEAQNNFYGLASAFTTRAKLLELEGNLNLAIDYARKGYDMSVKINALYEMARQSRTVYTLYKSNKDYKNALDFLERHVTYNDTLNSKDRGKAFADAETKFQTKQKEQQLLLKNLELEKSELKVNERNHLIYFFIGAFAVFLALLFMVYRQFNEKKKANVLLINKNEEIEKQKFIIEEKNKDITDSINYSKHIQQAIIPSAEKVKQYLPESFVIFKPKDIVSGDFYLVEEIVGLIYLAVVDCTGHGVPGAMLSVFADSNIKNSIASNNFRENPAAILSDLCYQFKTNLQSRDTTVTVNDGVDMSICIIDKKQNKIYFAGARNGLKLIRNGEFKEYEGNRWGISGSNKTEHLHFTNYIIEIEKGDKFYMSTDGFADQFGGPKGKKFKEKQLHKLLIDAAVVSLAMEKDLLEKQFEEWKGSLEQIDDVTLIGFAI